MNFGNKAQSRHRDKFLSAVKERGQAWSQADRDAHAERMRGSTNAMRGARHTDAARTLISAAKSRQYREGTVRTRLYKISSPEKAIGALFERHGLEFKSQFHIRGVPFLYDFCVTDRRLIVEFNGNYWHANPRKYAPGTILRVRGKDILVDKIWDRDASKRKAAESAGYRFIAIWEDEYMKGGDSMVIEAIA